MKKQIQKQIIDFLESLKDTYINYAICDGETYQYNEEIDPEDFNTGVDCETIHINFTVECDVSGCWYTPATYWQPEEGGAWYKINVTDLEIFINGDEIEPTETILNYLEKEWSIDEEIS